jgi:hypothetical protein
VAPVAETENTWLKAEKVVNLDIQLLRRQLVLGATVLRNAGADFAGAKDDTITVRVPARAIARRRVMRSATQIVTDDLHQFGVDVKLDTHIYSSVGVTDEEFTLDITDFGREVSLPQAQAVAEDIEDLLVEGIAGADYAAAVIDIDPDHPNLAITQANKLLNDAKVSKNGRVLVVGSAVEKAMLDAELFVRVDQSGSNSALERAVIDRRFGFTVLPSSAIDEGDAYAYTRDAFVLALQAPKIPDGASWGASIAADGFALRHLKDYDYVNTRDRSLVDVFAGVGVVEDPVDYTDPDSAKSFVRGVKLSLDGS